MNTKGKTIKQIADEIGVSKQAVHKKRKSKELSTILEPLTSTVDGVVYISVDGETILKQAFLRKDRQPVVGKLTSTVDSVVDGQVDSKKANDYQNSELINVLKQELEIKNKQIETLQQENIKLTSALENATVSLKASQALHAGTMQQISDSSITDKKKNRWFSSLFK